MGVSSYLPKPKAAQKSQCQANPEKKRHNVEIILIAPITLY